MGCSLFGRAASWARAAIQASYSGVPRRGGTSEGRPPIQCGMSAIRSPAVFMAHDVSMMHARNSKAQWIIGESRIMPQSCPGNVAIAMRNQGCDGTIQLPLTMIGFGNARCVARPGSRGKLSGGDHLLTACVYRLRNRGFRNSYRDA